MLVEYLFQPYHKKIIIIHHHMIKAELHCPSSTFSCMIHSAGEFSFLSSAESFCSSTDDVCSSSRAVFNSLILSATYSIELASTNWVGSGLAVKKEERGERMFFWSRKPSFWWQSSFRGRPETWESCSGGKTACSAAWRWGNEVQLLSCGDGLLWFSCDKVGKGIPQAFTQLC